MHCSKRFYRLNQLDGVLVFNEIQDRAVAARIEDEDGRVGPWQNVII
jgi:hypothetical protein